VLKTDCMEEVSHMLGHNNVTITQKYYARFTPDHLKQKVELYAFVEFSS
jgi:hypothetical protein